MKENQNIMERDRQAEEVCLIFDTHAHYDDAQFDEDREELLGRLEASGICGVIDVGAGLKSTARALALAAKYPLVHAAVGIHPTETRGLTEEGFDWLAAQLAAKKVVAVGEIGLDYHEDCPRDIQKYWFKRQLWLAVEKDFPVIIHSRDAAADTLAIVQQVYRGAQEGEKQLRGVIHCFSYGKEMAREYVGMGFFLGIGGVVTFKNARRTKEVVTETALGHLVLETDCPYLSPEPHRGERNSSLYLPLVAEEIARLKGITAQQVIRVTAENARRLYRL